MDGLTISKLAGEVGTSADTLRYYERLGLLAHPDRTPAGYRMYPDEAVERVRFIKRAQRFGLRLEDIGRLIEVREQGLCPCGGTRRLLEDRLAQLDEEMEALARLRTDIVAMLDDEPDGAEAASPSPCGPSCGAGLLQIRRQRPPAATEAAGRRPATFPTRPRRKGAHQT